MASTAFAPPTVSGPRPMPIVGGFGSWLQFMDDPVTYIQKGAQQFGTLFAITHNNARQMIAFSPEHNRLLLTQPDLFHTILETITPPRVKARRRGIGLLEMNGALHKQQRRLMMPAFHKKQIEHYRDDMVAFTDKVLARWRVGQQIDVAREMQQITLQIAGKTLFGLDLSDQAQGLSLYIKRLLDMPGFSPAVALFPYDLPGTPFRRTVRNADNLADEMLRLIHRKRADIDAHRDVLAMLIQARDEDGTAMTDTELIGQATTLLIAGHETSSNALTWTLLLLAQHPAVLADLQDELSATLRGAAPTIEQLQQLPLLSRVIDESLRLLPPAAISSRVSTGPFAIGPYHLPKGTIITFSPFMTHRIPALYADPQRFKPQRWEQLDPSPYEFMTFGAGPRMCIGATFAIMEIKIVLAMLLQRVRLNVPANATVDHQLRITLSPKGGLPMTVLPHDQSFAAVPVRGSIHRFIDLPHV